MSVSLYYLFFIVSKDLLKVRDGLMNKDELHDLIEKQQTNICQIVA